MLTAKRFCFQSSTLALAAGVAALWPLTAYALGPLVLPGLLAVGVGLAVIVWRPEYGLALTLALAPFTNLSLPGFPGSDKPLQLLLPALAFGILAYSALISPTRERSATSRWLTAAVLVFVAASTAASVQALDPSASMKKLFILLTAASLFFAVLEIATDERKLGIVISGALAGLLLAAANGVAQQYFGLPVEEGFVVDGSLVKRVQGSFGHANQYGGYLAYLIPLAAAVVLTRAFAGRMRLLAAGALLLAVPALTLSYARGAIAGLVLGSLIWLAIVRPRTALLAAVVVGAAAVTLAPATLRERFSPAESHGDVTLRADIWAAAVDIYTSDPVLGVGLNNFPAAYERLPSTLTNASQRRYLNQEALRPPPHAQNLYLNILAEEGVVGAAAFLLFAAASVTTFYRGCRARSRVGRSSCLACGAGLMGLAVHSLLEVTLFSEVALPLFSLLAAGAVFVALDDAEGVRQGSHPVGAA